MDNRLLDVIKKVTANYGVDIFNNMQRTNAVMLDLAPGMVKERILARSFIEIDGYNQLKAAGKNYTLVKNKLIKTLTETFSIERAAAFWVTNVFAMALGLEAHVGADLDAYAQEGAGAKFPDIYSPVAIGKSHTVAVAADGTVFSHGSNEYFQCDVSNWRGIVSVAAGDHHTVGLKENGTVITAGSNNYDQCDVSSLSNVESIYAFPSDTICVKKDGTAVAAGRSRFNLSHFTGIKTIARFPEGLFGIRADGTVQTAFTDDAAPSEVSEESRWAARLTGVVQIISTYVNGSIVLRNDGRIYKMGMPDNYFAQWQDIVSIVDLADAFAVLRKDGTVRVLPFDRDQSRKSSKADSWNNIATIYGKYKRLVGLTIDGGLLAACTDMVWLLRNGSLDFVHAWYPIRRPEDG